jgi:hypothetical protein
MPVQGERIAGFILITGIDGIRYAVRQHAGSVISDHDEAQDETCVVLHGGAVVRVPCSQTEEARSEGVRSEPCLYAHLPSRAPYGRCVELINCG